LSSLDIFQKEEKLRLWLQENAQEHDCEEAGCTLDPAGKKIPDEAKGKKRSSPPDEVKKLAKELRGLEL